MKTGCLLILSTGLLIAAAASADDKPAKDDLAKLRGTWLTVSLANDGKTLVDEETPPKEGPATKFVYDGNTWTVKEGNKTVATERFKIDTAKSPKEIDIMDESEAKNERTKLGIYKIDGDTYKFCLA